MPELPELLFSMAPVVKMTDAKFVSCNVPETDYPAWVVGTTYAAQQRVISVATHSVYESIGAGNVGHDPVADVDPLTGEGTYWLRVRATNRWKAFDSKIMDATATNLGSIDYVLMPGTGVDTLAIFNLVCDTLIVSVNGSEIVNIYRPKSTVLLENLDIPDDITTVHIECINPGATTIVGQISFGTSTPIGKLLIGGDLGFQSFSKKEFDIFGNTNFIPRGTSAIINYNVSIPFDQTLDTFTYMTTYEAAPCIFHGGEVSIPFGQVQLGFINDFNISQPNTKRCLIKLNVEGLV